MPGIALGADGAPVRVVLQLNTQPQFRAAGYFAALWEGYYSDAGLDVEIRTSLGRDDHTSAVDEVAERRADFGIAGADLLAARASGQDIVVLATILQATPGALYVRKDVRNSAAEGLAGRTVWRAPGRAPELEYRALMLAAGVAPDDIAPARPDAPFEDAAGFMGDTIETPLLLDERGIEARAVLPERLNLPLVGDSIFTTDSFLRKNPTVVEAFVQASLRGWRHALENPGTVADRLASEHSRQGILDARAYNRAQIMPVLTLSGYPAVDIGYVNVRRWQEMQDRLHELGLVSAPLDVSGFIYRGASLGDDRARTVLFATALLLTAFVLAGAGGAAVTRRVIRARTQALQRSEESYRFLVENIRDYAIYALDAEGRVISWNAAAERIEGWSRDEILGRHVALTYVPEDLADDLPDTELQKARQLGRLETQGWRQRKNGSRYWANVVLSAVYRPDGTVRGFTKVTRDVSHRKAQEDRIRFQAALLNRVRSAVIATNADGSVVYMNAYAEALFLISWREADHQRLEDLGILPPAVLADVDGGRIESEVTARRRDGAEFPALVIASVTPDTGGEGVQSAVYVVHDLTERKKMEAALQHSSNLALLGRMSASLVHEISQPMNVIRLTADGGLMKLQQGKGTEEDLAHRFRTIAEQAARLFDTIDFMQTFSRRDGGRGDATVGEPFDVWESIHRSVSMVASRAAQANVAIEVGQPDGPCMAVGRYRQFEQVLVNLLKNALQALEKVPPENDRLIRVAVDPQESPDDDVRVRVEDSGPGIPLELRQQVFEPFYTTKPPGEGTGLGLAISLGIIRSMNGRLEAGTSVMGGAAMEIRLQAAKPQTKGEGRETSPTVPETQRKPEDAAFASSAPHVLVVDDEELARREVAEFLLGIGWRVSEAASGNQALSLVRRANDDDASDLPPIDAVVTDIRMPDGSGDEMISVLAEEYPQVFIVVMTGQPLADRHQLETLGSGADVVLRKPISLNELQGRLQDLLLAEHADA